MMPMPSLALAGTAPAASMPMTSSISARVRSASADGRSILLMTGNDLQSLVEGHVDVGQRLGFHALARVHHQECPLARCQRAADLVRKVDVSRGVDEVQDVGVPILGRVIHPHRLGLDGDAPLALQLHVVQELGLRLAFAQGASGFEQPVRQRRLAVVDVGDDAEVPNVGVLERH